MTEMLQFIRVFQFNVHTNLIFVARLRTTMDRAAVSSGVRAGRKRKRSDRTVKVIAARKRRSIPEALHLHSVTPRDGIDAASSHACGLYDRYAVRDCVQSAADQPEPERAVAASVVSLSMMVV